MVVSKDMESRWMPQVLSGSGIGIMTESMKEMLFNLLYHESYKYWKGT